MRVVATFLSDKQLETKLRRLGFGNRTEVDTQLVDGKTRAIYRMSRIPFTGVDNAVEWLTNQPELEGVEIEEVN